MTSRSFGAPLEQSCIEPGRWLIEGYNVDRREYGGGPACWWISTADEHGRMVHRRVVASIADARDWIRQELARS